MYDWMTKLLEGIYQTDAWNMNNPGTLGSPVDVRDRQIQSGDSAYNDILLGAKPMPIPNATESMFRATNPTQDSSIDELMELLKRRQSWQPRMGV